MIQFLVFLVCVLTASYTKFDSGTFKQFNTDLNPSFQCINGAEYTGKIVYKGTFTTIPQIIIAALSYRIDEGAVFRFNILSTTIKECTFIIQCNSLSLQVYKYQITWIAVDDKKILVINDYMNSSLVTAGYTTPMFTFPYPEPTSKDPYTITQLYTFTSFGSSNYQVKINQLKIAVNHYPGLTPSDLQFNIAFQYGGNEMGAQVVIGLNISLSYIEQGQGDFLTTITRTRNTIIPPCKLLIFDIFAIGRLPISVYAQNNLDIAYSDTAQQIDIKASGHYYYFYLYYEYIGVTIYEPQMLKNMRISKMVSLTLAGYQYLYNLTLNELNRQFFKPQTLNFVHDTQALSITFEYECQPGKKIDGQILKCLDCGQQYQSFSQYCFKRINVMKFYISLKQSIFIKQDCNLNVTNEGFTLIQTIKANSLENITNTYIVMNLKIS